MRQSTSSIESYIKINFKRTNLMVGRDKNEKMIRNEGRREATIRKAQRV